MPFKILSRLKPLPGLLLIQVTLLALEAACWVFVLARGGDTNHFAAYQEEYATQMWNRSRVGHPYFGFVFDPAEDGVNNMGFVSQDDYPYSRQPEEFVVGIFGGSVAGSLAIGAADTLAEGIKSQNPKLKNKKIVILNFGLGMGKQPQSFFIASYFLPTLDLAITVDGFNEGTMEVASWLPQDFPSDVQFYLMNFKSLVSGLYKTMHVDSFRRTLTRLPIDSPLLAHSQSYFLFWQQASRIANSHLLSETNKLRHTEPQGKGKLFSSPPWVTKEHKRQERLQIWMRYTKQMSAVAKSHQVSSFHFIQPNQYVVDSKPLSEDELRMSYTGPNPKTDAWYVDLRKAARKLQVQGIKVHDLSMVFKDNRETLYMDTCCHLNQDGNRILAEAMAKQIKL